MDNSESKIQNLEFSVFHPTYFSSIYQFVKMVESKKIIFEVQDNFQKQTYRNRCYIFGANGKQLLNIPIQKVSGKQLTRDIKIDYNEQWQKQHLKSLISAYRSSPFFEFYIDDLNVIFSKKETYLLDLNINIFSIITALLPLDISFITSKVYKKEVLNDYRCLVNSKNNKDFSLSKYTQVFSDKLGFLSNLSVIDLLFMEGPNALLYLEKNIFSLN